MGGLCSKSGIYGKNVTKIIDDGIRSTMINEKIGESSGCVVRITNIAGPQERERINAIKGDKIRLYALE